MSLKYRDSSGIETPVAGLNSTSEDLSQIAQNTANFAPNFSETTSYAVGDYCTYDGKLYRCTIAHIAGVWVAEHFTATTACDIANTVVSGDMRPVTSNGVYYRMLTLLGNLKFITLQTVSGTTASFNVAAHATGIAIAETNNRSVTACLFYRSGIISLTNDNYWSYDNDTVTLTSPNSWSYGFVIGQNINAI